ncbi:hypothetical protein GCM10010400_46810 [Streptomyces aculeolatus]
MFRVEGIFADVPGRNAQYRYPGGIGDVSFQPVEMGVDCFRFPPGVGEYGVIDLREDPLGGKSEEGAGLNSRAEGKDAEAGLI